MNGDDRTRWREGEWGISVWTCRWRAKEGLDALTGPAQPGPLAAKRALAEAGYQGERVVLLVSSEVVTVKILADVTAHLLYKRMGAEPGLPGDGLGHAGAAAGEERIRWTRAGWSVFQTNSPGPDQANPAVNMFLRGNGRDAAPGWAVSPRIEELRNQWLADGRYRGAEEDRRADPGAGVPGRAIYSAGADDLTPTAYRANLTGVLDGAPVFWNVRRG